MRCLVCGHDAFSATQYTTAHLAAGALECLRCHALTLKVGESKPQARRKLVRRAEAPARNAISGKPTANGLTLSSAEVDALVNEVELVLVQARFDLNALAHRVDGDAAEFISDVRRCVQRVEELMGPLRRQ
jgi:hypothetical protein